MAGQCRNAIEAVADQLQSAPGTFDFFAAVSSLFRLSDAVNNGAPPFAERSGDGDFPVRFEAWQSRSFPAGDVVECLPEQDDQDRRRWRMTVSFFGLTGPNGVLPTHYTQMILDRIREFSRRAMTSGESSRPAIQDFFDIFNNRLLQLFYLAWRKYRLDEQFRSDEKDPVSRSLLSLIGMSTSAWLRREPDSLRNRLELPDRVLLYYGGLFSHWPRAAAPLQAALREFTGRGVDVIEFRPIRLALEPGDCTRLGQGGGLCELGNGAMVGRSVLSFDTGFRLRIGPLSLVEFRRHLPGHADLTRIAQFARTYVGVEYDFDVQLVLGADEIPPTTLGGPSETGSRLGWSTWLSTRKRETDADDVVLVDEGWPLSRQAAS